MNTDTPEMDAPKHFDVSPSELIHNKLKTRILGGYPKREVDILLERAADALAALQEENQVLLRKSKETEKILENKQELEDALRAALISAEKTRETIVTAAKREAEILMNRATVFRAQEELKLKTIPDDLRAEIKKLSEARDRFRDDFVALLETHKALLNRIPTAGVRTPVEELAGFTPESYTEREDLIELPEDGELPGFLPEPDDDETENESGYVSL
ncbi:MAG: DivIVA domain-containing protein [Candidatus Hydrogenedentales bacterium]